MNESIFKSNYNQLLQSLNLERKQKPMQNKEQEEREKRELEERKRQEEEERKRKIELERKKKEEEALARKKAEEEMQRKKQEEERKRKEEEERKRKEEELAKKRAQEEMERKKKEEAAEQLRKRKEEFENQKKMREDSRRKREEEKVQIRKQRREQLLEKRKSFVSGERQNFSLGASNQESISDSMDSILDEIQESMERTKEISSAISMELSEQNSLLSSLDNKVDSTLEERLEKLKNSNSESDDDLPSQISKFKAQNVAFKISKGKAVPLISTDGKRTFEDEEEEGDSMGFNLFGDDDHGDDGIVATKLEPSKPEPISKSKPIETKSEKDQKSDPKKKNKKYDSSSEGNRFLANSDLMESAQVSKISEGQELSILNNGALEGGEKISFAYKPQLSDIPNFDLPESLDLGQISDSSWNGVPPTTGKTEASPTPKQKEKPKTPSQPTPITSQKPPPKKAAAPPVMKPAKKVWSDSGSKNMDSSVQKFAKLPEGSNLAGRAMDASLNIDAIKSIDLNTEMKKQGEKGGSVWGMLADALTPGKDIGGFLGKKMKKMNSLQSTVPQTRGRAEMKVADLEEEEEEETKEEKIPNLTSNSSSSSSDFPSMGTAKFVGRSTFSHSYHATIGADFKVSTVKVGGKSKKMQWWDTAGQERFNALGRTVKK